MKKEQVITIIVVLIIIIGDLSLQKYTKNAIGEIKEELEKLKNNVLYNEVESKELAEEVSDIYEKWENKKKVLTYYIEHDELEKVNTELNKLKAFYEVDMKKDSMADIYEAIYILDHIHEKQKLSLKNIF